MTKTAHEVYQTKLKFTQKSSLKMKRKLYHMKKKIQSRVET